MKMTTTMLTGASGTTSPPVLSTSHKSSRISVAADALGEKAQGTARHLPLNQHALGVAYQRLSSLIKEAVPGSRSLKTETPREGRSTRAGGGGNL